MLTAFDELIDINERRIALVKNLARSLYREWFERLRFPGCEDAKLVDSDLGPIPCQWAVARLADILSFFSRGITPRYSAEQGSSLAVNQRCIRNHRVDLSLARRQDRPIPDGKQLQFGDVLINSTGVGTLGRVAIWRENLDAVTVDSHVTIARARDSHAQAWLALSMLKIEPLLQAMGVGSTGQTELGRRAIGEIRLAVPSTGVLVAFARLAAPLLDAIPLWAKETAALARTRDLLLPRIVSGRLNLPGGAGDPVMGEAS